QFDVLFLIQQFYTDFFGHSQGTVFGLVLFSRLQSLRIVTYTPPSLGTLGRTVTKNIFILGFVIADDIGLSPSLFHFIERPYFAGFGFPPIQAGLQLSLYLRPFQFLMTLLMLFKTFLQKLKKLFYAIF